MSSVYDQLRDNLNIPKQTKRREEIQEETDETIFDNAYCDLPIPNSFVIGSQELKGVSANCLATLDHEYGQSGQHILLIGRALKWLLFMKYGPLDWKTIKPFYFDYFVKTCQVPLTTITKFFLFKLEKNTTVEDHLKRLWNDFRNSAIMFWDRSLRYPSHELTYGALKDIYIRRISKDSFIPWPTPRVQEPVIFTMTSRYH